MEHTSIKKTHAAFDVLKVILALMVMAIHNDPVDPGGRFRYPVLSLAVPMFFIISSHLFFSWYDQAESREDRKRLVIKFVKRGLILYLAWFIVLFPLTVKIRGYFDKDILTGTGRMLRDFLIGTTFRSSWFLMANITGVLIVLLLDCIDHRLTAAAAVLLYIACMRRTCYNLLSPDSAFNIIIDHYPTTFYRSFPIAVFWVWLGKIITENRQKLSFIADRRILSLSVSFILLFAEYALLRHYGLILADGYCIFMIPVCIAIFITARNTEIGLDTQKALFLRHTSTVIYCFSTSLGMVLDKLYIKLFSDGFPHYPAVYFMTLFICVIVSAVIEKLSRYKHLRILKYFY